MTKEIWIYSCGIYSFGFAVFHIFFWKLFRWKDDLQKLSRPNRGIIQILNLRIIYYFIFVGTICFVFPKELGETQLGKFFLAGNALFWTGRTIEQFIFLRKPSHGTCTHLIIYFRDIPVCHTAFGK
ncbi:hypothetical protein [Sinomicrobium sp. M5D2P17]